MLYPVAVQYLLGLPVAGYRKPDRLGWCRVLVFDASGAEGKPWPGTLTFNCETLGLGSCSDSYCPGPLFVRPLLLGALRIITGLIPSTETFNGGKPATGANPLWGAFQPSRPG